VSGGAANDPAAEANSPTRVILEEVVVTAQKRVERLQDVPISVSVLSGTEQDRSTFTSTEDALATVPHSATLTDWESGGTQISLRGVSSSAALAGGSTPVAFYVDGAPLRSSDPR
jgi:iron complex outermembrane receptor protein